MDLALSVTKDYLAVFVARHCHAGIFSKTDHPLSVACVVTHIGLKKGKFCRQSPLGIVVYCDGISSFSNNNNTMCNQGADGETLY